MCINILIVWGLSGTDLYKTFPHNPIFFMKRKELLYYSRIKLSAQRRGTVLLPHMGYFMQSSFKLEPFTHKPFSSPASGKFGEFLHRLLLFQTPSITTDSLTQWNNS